MLARGGYAFQERCSRQSVLPAGGAFHRPTWPADKKALSNAEGMKKLLELYFSVFLTTMAVDQLPICRRNHINYPGTDETTRQTITLKSFRAFRAFRFWFLAINGAI